MRIHSTSRITAFPLQHPPRNLPRNATSPSFPTPPPSTGSSSVRLATPSPSPGPRPRTTPTKSRRAHSLRRPVHQHRTPASLRYSTCIDRNRTGKTWSECRKVRFSSPRDRSRDGRCRRGLPGRWWRMHGGAGAAKARYYQVWGGKERGGIRRGGERSPMSETYQQTPSNLRT